MKSNIVKAILNVCNYNERPNLEQYKNLKEKEESKNSAKAMGTAAECYIRDIFTDAYKFNTIEKKNEAYEKYLSYKGGSKNPPDFIIKKGAAVEVKKVESSNELQLNSSAPKQYLRSDSDKITKKCKNCDESWTKKDMVYAIVNQKNSSSIETIWLIDAKCYVANEKVYSEVFDYIKKSVENLKDIKTVKSKELARLVEIDQSNSTKLRIRSMWTLEHPAKRFDKFISKDDKKDFRVYALILKSTFDEYPEKDRLDLVELVKDDKIILKNTEVEDPDNFGQNLDVVLLKLIIKK